VFARQILRRIYGPVQTEEGWRVRNNDELEKLMRGEDTSIVNYIRAQRIKWWDILTGWRKTKTVGRNTEWHAIGMRSKGRSKNRWRDEVLNDLKRLNVKNWTYLVKEKPGMNWCRRPNPTKGFSVSRRSRRVGRKVRNSLGFLRYCYLAR
jgi:hypothetical protein